MAELKLTPLEEPPRPKVRRWVQWRFSRAESEQIEASILASTDRPRDDQPVRLLLRTLAYCTRAEKRERASRAVDPSWNLFVVEQIAKTPRRGLTQIVWAACLASADRTGTVAKGVRELSRDLSLDPCHVAKALGDLVEINALVKRVAWPDGPDYVVNAHVLPEGGGLLVHMEQAEHGKPVPYSKASG